MEGDNKHEWKYLDLKLKILQKFLWNYVTNLTIKMQVKIDIGSETINPHTKEN